MDYLIAGREADLEMLARKNGCGERSIFAFLAPSLAKAIAENQMPRGIGLTRMADLPSEWPMQRRVLGLADDASGHAPG